MIVYLKLLHGLYNILIFFLVLYQAWRGFTIRRRRKRNIAPDFTLIRGHRKSGPVLLFLVCMGYLAGIAVALADSGRILKYPIHFITGSILVILAVSAFLISRDIKGPSFPLRNLHSVLGSMILPLYIVQILLGLEILF